MRYYAGEPFNPVYRTGTRRYGIRIAYRQSLERYIFERKKELSSQFHYWEKVEIVMPKRHRFTLVQVDIYIQYKSHSCKV